MRMMESNRDRNPTRRPWYRLHLSTWLTLPLGLVVAVFVVLPGGVGEYPERSTWMLPLERGAIVHGWPLPYLWRTPQGWSGDPAKAKSVSSVEAHRFSPRVSLVASRSWIWPWRGWAGAVRRASWNGDAESGGERLQFTLRELSGVRHAHGGCFHLVGSPTRDRPRNDGPLRKASWLTGSHLVPRVPLWLRMLSGIDRLSQLGINGPDGPIQLQWDLVAAERYSIRRRAVSPRNLG